MTLRWLEQCVIGLNLCPFAKAVIDEDRLRIEVTQADDQAALLQSLVDELDLLSQNIAIESTLLVHPNVLADFHEYNAFLGLCDNLLVEMHLEGVFQIASFHPAYQFADAGPDAVENYTNRSPLPMLHILRETSVSRAVESYPNIEKIPERNIARLQSLGIDTMQQMVSGDGLNAHS